MRKDLLDRKDEILQWISENQSNTFIAKQLQCKIDTLKRFYKRNEIDYKGNQGGKGIKHDPKRKTALEYIESTSVKSSLLKKKLIEDGLKEDICENCGQKNEWFGKKLPLELHHIDGNHLNNNLSNLQILCPNCHSVQDGNAGSNIGKYNK